MLAESERNTRTRLRKSERLERILLELKLRPHVRISELSERFSVSAETIRRDFEALSEDQWVAIAKGMKTRPPMPWFSVNVMSEGDLRAMYKFVRSLGPAGEPAPQALPPGGNPERANHRLADAQVTVRFGSFADLRPSFEHVRFVPLSGT